MINKAIPIFNQVYHVFKAAPTRILNSMALVTPSVPQWICFMPLPQLTTCSTPLQRCTLNTRTGMTLCKDTSYFSSPCLTHHCLSRPLSDPNSVTEARSWCSRSVLHFSWQIIPEDTQNKHISNIQKKKTEHCVTSGGTMKPVMSRPSSTSADQCLFQLIFLIAISIN